MDAGNHERTTLWHSPHWHCLAFWSSTVLVRCLRHAVVVLAKPNVLRVPIKAELTAHSLIGETSPFHSLTSKKANRRRKLVKWPGYNNWHVPFVGPTANPCKN